MEVYGLVYLAGSATHYTQLPPGHRTCSFICHLNSPGSIQPCFHHSAGNCSNTQKPCVSYQVSKSLFLGGEGACVGKVPCLGTQHLSMIKPRRRLKLVISFLQVMHAATEPRCPNSGKLADPFFGMSPTHPPVLPCLPSLHAPIFWSLDFSISSSASYLLCISILTPTTYLPCFLRASCIPRILPPPTSVLPSSNISLPSTHSTCLLIQAAGIVFSKTSTPFASERDHSCYLGVQCASGLLC